MKRSWNPGLWAGFVLVFAGIVSYPLFFARFPVTRDLPWANLLIIAFALLLMGIGVGLAFGKPDQYRGKISGSILSVIAVLVVVFFFYEIFYVARQMPASHGAPRVGDLAPDFTLPDSKNDSVTLSALINSPFVPSGPSNGTVSEPHTTAATLLIFYRGYW